MHVNVHAQQSSGNTKITSLQSEAGCLVPIRVRHYLAPDFALNGQSCLAPTPKDIGIRFHQRNALVIQCVRFFCVGLGTVPDDESKPTGLAAPPTHSI